LMDIQEDAHESFGSHCGAIRDACGRRSAM
jgi:hypothetical protein